MKVTQSGGGDSSATVGPCSTGIRRVVLIGIENARLGGVSGFMNTLGHGLLARGYEIEIIGLQPSPSADAYTFERDPRISLRTIHRRVPPKWVRMSGFDRFNPVKVFQARRWQWIRNAGISRLRPIVAEWGPETLVICTQIPGMEYLIPAGLEPGGLDSPYVIAQYHGSRDMSVTLGSIHRLRKWYVQADRLLALTPTDAEAFRVLDGLNNAGYIYNPIGRQKYEQEEARENVVVSLNRYDSQKSLDWLLRAWAIVSPEFPDWRLRLYGSGPLQEDLASLIEDLGIAASASLEGVTGDPERVLRQSKVHAMTSQYEGLPLAIMEAAAAGVPTISFDCAPGIRDLIEDRVTGLVVPKNQLVGLIQALRQLMGDDGLRHRYGVQAEDFSKQFSLDNIVDEWEREMRSLARDDLVNNLSAEERRFARGT